MIENYIVMYQSHFNIIIQQTQVFRQVVCILETSETSGKNSMFAMCSLQVMP